MVSKKSSARKQKKEIEPVKKMISVQTTMPVTAEPSVPLTSSSETPFEQISQVEQAAEQRVQATLSQLEQEKRALEVELKQHLQASVSAAEAAVSDRCKAFEEKEVPRLLKEAELAAKSECQQLQTVSQKKKGLLVDSLLQKILDVSFLRS